MTMHAMKIAAISILAGTASAQFWTTDFGFLEGISNTGVGSGSFGTANNEYFTWDATNGSQGIGGVAAGNGVGGQGKISNDGRYISGTTYNAANDWHEMSRYDRTTGTWEGFGMLPGFGQQIDAEVSSGWGISGDGRSVVGLGWTNLGTADAHASQWTEGAGL
ncbi:MAG: hypothetical protein KDA28_10885, partial [Phycisphaerales bacterium]|nr:hypothetical protein [Phycisphaerales bacterium]